MKRIEDLWKEAGVVQTAPLDICPIRPNEKHRVNLLALGDVGMTVLIGLRLLGSDVISELGICDINPADVDRLEIEMNQINYPFGLQALPPVKKVTEAELKSKSSDLKFKSFYLTTCYCICTIRK